MKNFITAFLMVLLFCTASFAQGIVNVTTGWDRPGQHVNGDEISPDEELTYTLYVCESSISDEKGCDATLRKYESDVNATSMTLQYNALKDFGTLHMRAATKKMNNGLEGPLSNEITAEYDLREANPPVIRIFQTMSVPR